MKKRISFLLIIFSLLSPPAQAQRASDVILYFFWGDGCRHCAHEKPFLETLKSKYKHLVVRPHEVWHHPENKKLYQQMAAVYGVKSGSVPATFVGGQVWIGYSEKKAREIEQQVQRCLKQGCPDPLMVSNRIAPQDQDAIVEIPGVGAMDAAKMSLPLLTFVLAGMDGFNPCAFFVLLMLLSLLVHARSRFRMLWIGGIFVFFSGFVYFLFMAAWLNLFLVIGRVEAITTVAGLVALLFAMINIKDYFVFKKGISLTIPEQAKPSLFERMRKLLNTSSLAGMTFGTIVLAAAANMYELLCTAGFPMVYTRALTLRSLPLREYYLYLILYNVIYVIPLFVIVGIFTWTLGSRKLSESEGRVLKLLSGLMMLGLGAILVGKPSLLNNVLVSLGLLAAAGSLTGLIVTGTKKKKSSASHEEK